MQRNNAGQIGLSDGMRIGLTVHGTSIGNAVPCEMARTVAIAVSELLNLHNA